MSSENRIINIAWFQAVWWGMVYMPEITQYIGPLLILAHLAFLKGSKVKEAIFIVLIGILGFSLDTLLSYVGVMSFYPGSVVQIIPPMWLLVLWLSFACTIRNSLAFIFENIGLAFVCGGLGGVASYYGAEKLGALEFIMPDMMAVSYLAVIWAFLFVIFKVLKSLVDEADL